MKQVNNRVAYVLLLLGLHGLVTAQNPAIFKGGTADGWVSKNYTANSNNIFKGGVADGWTSQQFLQGSANIFKGGIADGWASLNYQTTSGNLFRGGFSDGWASINSIQQSLVINKGGISDGWASINSIQQSLVINKGGFSDGWASINLVQQSKIIQKGGIGDGWASTYRPQGPLPITLLSFTAQKQGNSAVLVQWRTSSEINTNYFDVERSNDAINFLPVGRVSAAGNSSREISYSFTDNQPLRGVNYYRLREVDLDGHQTYTPARLVRFDDTNSGIVRYYPNPTNGILNIEISQNMLQEAMVINISNAAGIVVDQLKVQSSPTAILQINMKKFARGTYFIQLKTNSSTNVQRVVLQ